ncbi:MAG: hypothetical protein U9Q78_06210 [Chloroflexota bacterium]|nr:hypothetical protein [Chloroflexota bacterium]
MDPTTLAQNIIAFLTPFLPYLLKAGERAGEKFGAEAWEQAKALWIKLRGNEEVKKAARDAAAMPDDSDAEAALRLQLKKLLAQDETLAKELSQMWWEAQATGVTVTASGERSVAIGGGVKGSTIITGDRDVGGDHSRSEVK